MASRSEDLLKKQLEDFAGREIGLEADQLKWLEYPVGASHYTADGYVASRMLFSGQKRCRKATLLDVDGASYTGPDGKRILRLSDYACFPGLFLRGFREPVNLLATARGTQPFFVTTTHSLVETDLGYGNILDTEITVCGWDTKGKSAPDVPFHWRCRLHAVIQGRPPVFPGVVLD